MTLAKHPHPISMRRAWLPGVALIAIVAASLLVVDWAATIPSGVAHATAARGSDSPPVASSMDTGQQFYLEKTRAPVEELPAQF